MDCPRFQTPCRPLACRNRAGAPSLYAGTAGLKILLGVTGLTFDLSIFGDQKIQKKINENKMGYACFENGRLTCPKKPKMQYRRVEASAGLIHPSGFNAILSAPAKTFKLRYRIRSELRGRLLSDTESQYRINNQQPTRSDKWHSEPRHQIAVLGSGVPFWSKCTVIDRTNIAPMPAQRNQPSDLLGKLANGDANHPVRS